MQPARDTSTLDLILTDMAEYILRDSSDPSSTLNLGS